MKILEGQVLDASATGTGSKNEPLVSIGIPTYNRPGDLRKALACITAQTYRNLEIIVSDNCSPGDETGHIVQEFMKEDPRISWYRQPQNRGAVFNVNFVLESSHGEFFMWAADDDLFGKDFVSRCLEAFSVEDDVVAVTMEARYFSDEKKFEFFPEGRRFYSFASEYPEERLLHMIRYAYGNLFYSIYRRKALVESGRTLYSKLSAHGLNEIPFFLVVVEQGNWRVIPQIGFCKQTGESVYLQARWEMTGGFLAGKGIMRYFGQLKADLVYHYHSFRDINQAISLLRARNKGILNLTACWTLAKHLCFLALHYKPRVRISAPDLQPGTPKSH